LYSALSAFTALRTLEQINLSSMLLYHWLYYVIFWLLSVSHCGFQSSCTCSYCSVITVFI